MARENNIYTNIHSYMYKVQPVIISEKVDSTGARPSRTKQLKRNVEAVRFCRVPKYLTFVENSQYSSGVQLFSF